MISKQINPIDSEAGKLILLRDKCLFPLRRTMNFSDFDRLSGKTLTLVYSTNVIKYEKRNEIFCQLIAFLLHNIHFLC